MNETTLSSEDVQVILGVAASAAPETISEGAEVFVDSRPILSTPLNDYTVSEGLLLLILLVLVFRFIVDAVRGVF